jgi:hypothetical protein
MRRRGGAGATVGQQNRNTVGGLNRDGQIGTPINNDVGVGPPAAHIPGNNDRRTMHLMDPHQVNAIHVERPGDRIPSVIVFVT